MIFRIFIVGSLYSTFLVRHTCTNPSIGGHICRNVFLLRVILLFIPLDDEFVVRELTAH